MSQAKLLSLQAECLLFFEQNPYTIENEEGLSIRLGRNLQDLSSVLERLTELSILQRMGEGEEAYYRYNLPEVMGDVSIWDK